MTTSSSALSATNVDSVRTSGDATTGPVVSRIDPPHAPPLESPSDPDLLLTEPEPAPDLVPAGETATEQLHAQALQLADHLRSKQRELDRREAILNARDARLENDLRLARGWLQDREAELSSREDECRALRATLDEKAHQLATLELCLNQDAARQQAEQHLLQRAWDERDAALQAEATRLDQERAALATALERFEQARVEQATARLSEEQQQAARLVEWESMLASQLRNLEQRGRALDEREAALDQRVCGQFAATADRDRENKLVERWRHVEETEAMLTAHARDIDAARESLARERRECEAALRRERQEWAAAQQRAKAQLAEQSQRIAMAQETLDKHRAAVDQLREETAHVHREALEMRLITQQLWLELSARVPSAEATRALAALRQRWADAQRREREEMAAQQTELTRLASRLEDQAQKLTAQRDQLRDWFAVRERDIESQAARLVARELELDGETRALAEREARWAEERNQLQAEIRRRMLQLGIHELAAS